MIVPEDIGLWPNAVPLTSRASSKELDFAPSSTAWRPDLASAGLSKIRPEY